jgi:glutamate racemase
MSPTQPIGVFDSGYGGLTVLKSIVEKLPQYDYVYLGDNARTPYGTRSFETVYHYTLECVQHLFDMGCRLVILACNTASAKALRNIQQLDLPIIAPDRRVLGVIRPTTEVIEITQKPATSGFWRRAEQLPRSRTWSKLKSFFRN